MDPSTMEGYGYGDDNLDSKFAKFNQFNIGSGSGYPYQQPQQQPQHQQQPQQFAYGQQPQQNFIPQQQQYYNENQQQQQQQYVQDQAQSLLQPDPNQPQQPPPPIGKFADKFNKSFPEVKKDLLFAKAFYFFFFAAFGSLFPLIGIYFKQLGMSPVQTGFLIGLRPFVELFAGPFWGELAERYKKWKLILIGSLACWIIFTDCLAFVQPKANSCLIHNGTNIFVAKPFTISGLQFEDMDRNGFGLKESGQERRKRSIFNYDQIVGYNIFSYNTFVDSIKTRFRRTVPKKSRTKDKKRKTTTTTTTVAPEPEYDIIEYEGEDEEAEAEQKNSQENVSAEKSDKSSEESKKEEHNGKEDKKEDKSKSKENDAHEKKNIKEEKEEKLKPKKEEKEVKVKNSKEGKDEKLKNNKEEEAGNHKIKANKNDEEEDEEEEDEEYYEIEDDEPFDATKNTQQTFYQFKHFPYPAIDIPGISPLPINHKHIANLEENDVRDLVSPPLSAVVYKLQDVRSVFLILLILQILGEFLSTPAITLADTATLGYLEGQTDNYGKQRIYGSLGWAVAMFFVGIALDHSNVFSRHPCGTEHLVDRNYMTCYAVFGVLMFCALISATQFKFRETDSPIQTVQLQQLKSKVMEKVQKLGNKQDGVVGDQTALNNNLLAPQQQQQQQPQPINPVDLKQPMNKPSPLTYIPKGKPGQVGTLPHWITVLKMFAPIQFSSVFFLLWFSGFGVGLVFAFLFWHLQDLGGSPTLFGLASVVNHLSELGAFLFIKRIVAKFGHINVIYAGLLANVVRFLCISYLGNAWLVLPLEFLQGLTHASVWASGVSYMTQTIPDEYKPTAQLILQAVHLAVGRGCGTVIGGIFISSFGTASVFRGYGVTCLIVGLGYFALNFFFISKLPPIMGAPQMTNDIETDPYLAPHGVPGSTITASTSSTKLNQHSGNNMFGNNISNDYYTGPPYNNNANDPMPINNFQGNTTNYPNNDPYITEPQQMTQGIYRPTSNQWRPQF